MLVSWGDESCDDASAMILGWSCRSADMRLGSDFVRLNTGFQSRGSAGRFHSPCEECRPIGGTMRSHVKSPVCKRASRPIWSGCSNSSKTSAMSIRGMHGKPRDFPRKSVLPQEGKGPLMFTPRTEGPVVSGRLHIMRERTSIENEWLGLSAPQRHGGRTKKSRSGFRRMYEPPDDYAQSAKPCDAANYTTPII